MERHQVALLNARRAARAALDFLLPATCVACERLLDHGENGLVCGRCWCRLALLPAPRCERCGHPVRGACTWCELLPDYVRSARSVCWTHRGTGAAVVHALKYRGWHAVAAGMSERMARLAWPPDVRDDRDAFIPVPLSASRERERGFNQSERLARALGERLRVAVWSDVLERARVTETQTRLTPEQRLANVSGAFRVRDAGRLRDSHAVLVDDVITTGATLNACAEALVAAGAGAISYITFGRAPAPGDR